MALALGLILGLGLAFLIETLDTRVRSAEELAAAVELPLLGTIPRPPRRLRARRRLVMLDNGDRAATEPFRILRTRLDLALPSDCRALMFTSALEAEGKSTTAANVAVSMARAGRRVVLVDLDLQHPGLHGLFDLPAGPGITDVALGKVLLEDAVTDAVRRVSLSRPSQGDSLGALPPPPDGGTNAGRLELLRAGSALDGSDDFISSFHFDVVLEQLRHRSDLVIVDGPPLLLSGDALMLSAKLDAVVVVARLNTFRRTKVHELNQSLAACPAAKLGVIVTWAAARYYGYGVRQPPRQLVG
jgi:Mrp family chromosome partitioning ATPase